MKNGFRLRVSYLLLRNTCQRVPSTRPNHRAKTFNFHPARKHFTPHRWNEPAFWRNRCGNELQQQFRYRRLPRDMNRWTIWRPQQLKLFNVSKLNAKLNSQRNIVMELTIPQKECEQTQLISLGTCTVCRLETLWWPKLPHFPSEKTLT